MTFKELINSPVFFNTFIKNEVLFNSIKNKFPNILADLTSSRDNPNCSCKNRVKTFLETQLDSEVNYFNDLLNMDEAKKIIQEKSEEIKNTQIKNPLETHLQLLQQNMFRSSEGRVFEIGKTEEDWKNLTKKINNEKLNFKSFSVVEKEDKLVVYFI